MTRGSLERRVVLREVLVRVRIVYRLVWIILCELLAGILPVRNVLGSSISSEVRRFVNDSSSLLRVSEM